MVAVAAAHFLDDPVGPQPRQRPAHPPAPAPLFAGVGSPRIERRPHVPVAKAAQVPFAAGNDFQQGRIFFRPGVERSIAPPVLGHRPAHRSGHFAGALPGLRAGQRFQ
ncbi:MAG: hypothetical protein L0099_03565, partial [Acidobacteria bacterium]|nr:hypothetical protein [Acidobacteriota bacterium]